MADVTGMTPARIAQEITNKVGVLQSNVEAELSTKANTTYVDSELSEKANTTDVASELSKKANTTDVASELSKKASTTYVNTELSKKAYITYVDNGLSKKSDTTYVNSELSKKVNATYVNSELSKKADKTYVDNSTNVVGYPTAIHAGKFVKLNNEGKLFINSDSITNIGDIVNKWYVDNGLSEKADTTYVNSELSEKADITYVNSELSEKADITYVNSELSEKADTTYVESTKWFRRNILRDEDLNDFTETGLYIIPLSNTMTSLANRPFGSTAPGFLVVTNSGGTIIQELTNYSSNGPITMSRTTLGGVFQEWVNPAAVTKPFLWTDLNEAVIEGDYDIGRYSDVRDLVNRPPATPIPAGARISVRLAGGTRLIQEWVGIITGGIGERWQRNRNSTGAWEAWTLVHSDISRAEVLSLLEDFAPETVNTDHVVTVGDSQVGATYGWANLLAGVSGQTVVNRGKSGNTPDEALLMTGGWRLPIEPVALIPGERVPVSFAGDYPVLGRDFSHHGYVLGKRVSLWYTHSTGGWEALLNAEEEPLTLSSPTLWASIYADFAPERLSRRIVWFGGNSIRTGRHRPGESLVEHVQKAYSRAIDAWGETTLVFGYVPAHGDVDGRDAANELNSWLSRTVPMQFLDMRHRLQLAASEIIGRDLSASELQDIADGYLPRPLYRSDLVHLTDEAHVKIAEIVAEFPKGATPSVSIRSKPAPVVSLTGAGAPEGTVSAAVGSIYTDTAATNGAIRWIKSSGEGSTGWKVEYGDTGWRDITSLLTSSPAIVMGDGAKIAIRRTSGSVFFRVIGPATMAGTFGNIVAAQPGLRPDLDTNSPAAKGASFRNTRSWIRLEDGTRDAVLTESGRAVETMWSTTEAWPTALPGIPA